MQFCSTFPPVCNHALLCRDPSATTLFSAGMRWLAVHCLDGLGGHGERREESLALRGVRDAEADLHDAVRQPLDRALLADHADGVHLEKYGELVSVTRARLCTPKEYLNSLNDTGTAKTGTAKIGAAKLKMCWCTY